MKQLLATLMILLAAGGPPCFAAPAPELAAASSYLKVPVQDARHATFRFPPAFERERGVSWDGRIGWKTETRVWVFAAALEGSLKEVVRADSPYRLKVAVVQVEVRTGRFVVEFAVQDPSGASVELVQVEGLGPAGRSLDEVCPAVAGEMVTAFKNSVLK